MTADSPKTGSVVFTHAFPTPIGMLHAVVDKAGRVLHLGFRSLTVLPADTTTEENKYACGELEYQLEEYFAGERNSFSVDVHLEGSQFQKTVWNRLQNIPYGTTMTYGEVGRRIGRRDAARAVGNAVAVNPVILIVPCHRVVPAGGGIGNYAVRSLPHQEGRGIKRFLLELEAGQRNLPV